MRIISGRARGRKLITPPSKDNAIRPTADRAREALFSILGYSVIDAQVLDLFAGTGALGLEAYSRGSKNIVFVDKGHTSLQLLKQNLSIFSNEETTEKMFHVIKDDLKRPSFVKKLPHNIKPEFDLIFADPPYDKGFALPILQYICDENLLTPDGTIVIEERHTTLLPNSLTNYERIDRRTYGEASFSFYQRKNPVTIKKCDRTIMSEDDKGAGQ